MLPVLTHSLKRPVRISLDRDEDMQMTGGRHPFLGRWKIGFTKEGIFKAIKIDLYSNGGCSLDLSGAVMGYALLNHDNVYRYVCVD